MNNDQLTGAQDQRCVKKIIEIDSRYNSLYSPVINPRKLAAIDIVFLGSKVIIAEFAGGVLLCVALGTFVLFRGHSFWQLALGLYFIALGITTFRYWLMRSQSGGGRAPTRR